ncbi:MAG: TolC family protein [Pirellulaceae bacterium]
MIQDVTASNNQRHWHSQCHPAVSKTSATRATFSLVNDTQYDNNDGPNNLFNHSWTTSWDLQARQPLLQGAGVTFNRIAGPSAQPGFRSTSGLLISRANYDISTFQFEQGLQQFVYEVIGKYWQLSVAYRNFDSIRSARDSALKNWNLTEARLTQGIIGGEADREAEAREQYYLFESQLAQALSGDSLSGEPGVLSAEADLRRLMGLPNSGDRIIRPIDEPISAAPVFEWEQLLDQALARRPEIAQQEIRIQQRELELIAAKNFLLPRLDAVAIYRKNGFGDDLLGGGPGRFSSAYKDLASGQHDEWETGLQLQIPIGYRQAHSGVRYAELNLRKAEEVLKEQKNQIALDLGNAFRQAEQVTTNSELLNHRLKAAHDTVNARKAAFDAGKGSFYELLDAQRRLAEAELAFHRSLVNIELAVEGINRESGMLLRHHLIYLGESAAEIKFYNPSRQTRRKQNRIPLDYRLDPTRLSKSN